MSTASRQPRLTAVPVPAGSRWAQEEDGDADLGSESYGYDDDYEEEEEEETNMIPGSRDRGTPPLLRAQLPALHRVFLQHLPPVPGAKQSKPLASEQGAQCAHTPALSWAAVFSTLS